MGRRVLAVLAAVVVALIGVVAVLVYAKGADARAAAEHALELYAEKGHAVGEGRAAAVLAPRLSPQP